MIEWLEDIDRKLFLAINGANSESLDTIMFWVSNKLTWIPFYILLSVFVVLFFKRRSWIVFIAVVPLILLTDQGANMFKNTFAKRYRPCHNLELAGKVHVVGNCGGTHGFFSSHAANTMGLAVFLGLLFIRHKKWILPALILWAILIAYSRVYCGVHYPADVIAGMLWGTLWGWIAFFIVNRYLSKQQA
jgi:undecaprenyl-diphosphatase